MDNETGAVAYLLCMMFLLVIIVSLFELGFLVYAYFNADKVTCNGIWCEFTQERTTIESRVSSECYKNGIQVNCSNNINNIDVDDIIKKAMKE